MAISLEERPERMASPETGETLRRGVRPFVVVYKGKSVTVELPGYYPENGTEGVHVGDDMDVTDAVLQCLRAEVGSAPRP